MKTLTIIGKRWFDRKNGNTYFSTRVVIDGEWVDGVAFAYGYDDAYVEVTYESLEERGLVPLRERHATGGRETPRIAAERAGVKLTYSAADVARRKDLTP